MWSRLFGKESIEMSIADVERGLIARYLARILSNRDIPTRSARHILYWLYERSDSLTLPLPTEIRDIYTNYYSGGFKQSDFERLWLKHRDEIVDMLDRAASETPRPEPLATNLERLVDALGVPRAAVKIVGLIATSSRFDQIQYLSNTVLEALSPPARAIAMMSGEPTRVVDELLAPSSELMASGLVQVRDGESHDGYGGRYFIPTRVNSCLDRMFETFDDMRNALLGDPARSPVTPDDYEHVATDRDMICGLLRGAAKEAATGINILIYGPPGSGKTELAKVSAEAAGLQLFAAGEDLHQDGESDRIERLADLVFAQRLLAGQKGSALLFDEMEDIAVHLIRRGGSKVYLNRLLETNPVPIIWTSNELGHIDPALLRRMTLAIELKRPPAAQRKRIMERLADRVGVTLSDAEMETLAARLDATPAIIENALRAARFTGGGAAAVERAAQGIVRAVSGTAIRRPGVVADYDPALACASEDLAALTDRLVMAGARSFSLCLSGPPGTGKSAFARYLAKRLGIEVIHKRASDILGPFVGQSERNIADAFEEARETEALLVFDEADSLLLDRRDAVRSWEITQVNEMLTWMEEHPLPVCFTTNLMDRIDTASLRRFTFHVRFEYLDQRALKHAWQVFFDMSRVPTDALAYQNLTPGDFAKARKQADMLGILDSAPRLVALLGDISRGKPGAKGGLGFMT